MSRRTRNVLVVAALLAVAIVAVLYGTRYADAAFTQDSVNVLQLHCQSLIRDGTTLTPTEIADAAQRFQRASVCNYGFDALGRPTDSWDTPLQVDLSTGNVISAGPDRQFQTPDDIAATVP